MGKESGYSFTPEALLAALERDIRRWNREDSHLMYADPKVSMVDFCRRPGGKTGKVGPHQLRDLNPAVEGSHRQALELLKALCGAGLRPSAKLARRGSGSVKAVHERRDGTCSVRRRA